MGRRKLPKLDPVTGEKRVPRQRRWEQKQRELGNCIICGQPKGDSPYKNLCRRHGAMHRLAYRTRTYGSAANRNRALGRLIDIPIETREELDRVFPKVPPNKSRKKASVLPQ